MLLLALLLVNINPVVAETNLYTIELEVPDRSGAAVDQVMAAALDQALVRISGQSYASANGAYNDEVKGWVLRYGFRSLQVPMADGTPGKQLRTVISLDSKQVDQARAALGLPIWTGDRPQIALWVALDNNGLRGFLPEGAEYTRYTLQDSARQRGVSLQLPAVVADGEVLAEAPELADVWGGFPEQMMPVAQAVGADTILLAAASKRDGQWQIRWNMLSLQSNASFTSEALVLEGALVDGLNQVIDSIASLQAIDISDQGYWRESIDIIHLPDAAAYHQLMDRLKQHRLVDKVQVESVAGQRLRLVLELNASPAIVWGELDSLVELAYVGIGIGGVAAVFEFQLPEIPLELPLELIDAE